MLNSEHKRKIDNLRDLLVGKIPNPQGQVQQITLGLIYKFMSDIDDETAGIFEHASFFEGEFSKYKWKEIMNPKFGAQERLNIYAEGIEKMHENPKVPQLFRNIFKHAFLPFRDPGILDRFLKQLDEFHYEHSEDLGDAFEYLLSCLSAAGDAGMFRTPRHIIDFIVDVVDPQFGETILDPACGTAGFLIGAFKHIVAENPQAKNKLAELSPKFVGYDISPDMVQLALVNLYLHQFPDPKIFEYDTLTYEDHWGDKFDCILANPPFMSPKGGIQPHNRFSVKSNRSEVLFVDYMMDHLKSNGKAGIIVPEGVIFQSGTAYKQLRRKMIEENYLWGVVSLPAGIFNPYSGVKTSILLFDKTIASKTDKILFIKVDNDGYDLGAQRKSIDKNDISSVLRTLTSYKDSIKTDNALVMDGNSLILVSKEQIEKSGDHNLSMERYREVGAVNSDWPIVELGEIFDDLKIGGTPSRSNDTYFGGENLWVSIKDMEGKSIILDTKEKLTDKGVNDSNCKLIRAGSLLMSFKLTVGRTAFAGKDLYTNEAIIAFEPNGKVNLNYLKYVLLSATKQDKSENNMGVLMLNKDKIKKLKIPLPPITIQEQIAEELDGYQRIVDGAKMVVENWKPTIEINPERKMVRIDEICDLVRGSSPRPQGDPRYYGGPIPRLMVADVTRDGMFVIPKIDNLTSEGAKLSRPMKKGEVVMAVSGNPGVPAILGIDACIHDGFVGYRNLSEKILPTFLYYILLYKKANHHMVADGAVFLNFTTDQIKKSTVPLPPLDIQKQIVTKIEEEKSKIDVTAGLADVFEYTIEKRIRRIRGEQEEF